MIAVEMLHNCNLSIVVFAVAAVNRRVIAATLKSVCSFSRRLQMLSNSRSHYLQWVGVLKAIAITLQFTVDTAAANYYHPLRKRHRKLNYYAAGVLIKS